MATSAFVVGEMGADSPCCYLNPNPSVVNNMHTTYTHANVYTNTHIYIHIYIYIHSHTQSLSEGKTGVNKEAVPE